MADGLTIKLRKNDWPKMATAMSRGLADDFEDLAQDLLTDMVDGAPYDHLQDGLTVKRRGTWSRDYWAPWDSIFAEFGTAALPARPFVEPAVGRIRSSMAGLLHEALR